MVDRALVAKKLDELERRIRQIRADRPGSSPELAADESRRDLVAFRLMLAVQACLDIASHLLADQGWGMAPSAGEAFGVLAKHGVISPSTAEILSRAAGLRNLIAHGYGLIDLEKLILASTAGLTDLEGFATEVAVWMRGR
jgi:uncharacterized protein YutE (UPF0331/DUF86 family)